MEKNIELKKLKTNKYSLLCWCCIHWKHGLKQQLCWRITISHFVWQYVVWHALEVKMHHMHTSYIHMFWNLQIFCEHKKCIIRTHHIYICFGTCIFSVSVKNALIIHTYVLERDLQIFRKHKKCKNASYTHIIHTYVLELTNFL